MMKNSSFKTCILFEAVGFHHRSGMGVSYSMYMTLYSQLKLCFCQNHMESLAIAVLSSTCFWTLGLLEKNGSDHISWAYLIREV